MADFQLLPVSRAYLVMVDISTLEGGRIFEEATGQNNVLFKVSEELMSQNGKKYMTKYDQEKVILQAYWSLFQKYDQQKVICQAYLSL